MDEGGEALSPLLACKALHLHAVPLGSPAAALAAAAAALAAPMPGSGSVGGTPPPRAAAAAPEAGIAAACAAAAAQPLANGAVKLSAGQAGPAGGGGAASKSHGDASPIDLSTMAVDLAPPANGVAHPQPSASFQPSGLPPAAAVAAALAALEQQQAALNGGQPHTPPHVPPELGELYQALQQQVWLGAGPRRLRQAPGRRGERRGISRTRVKLQFPACCPLHTPPGLEAQPSGPFHPRHRRIPLAEWLRHPCQQRHWQRARHTRQPGCAPALTMLRPGPAQCARRRMGPPAPAPVAAPHPPPSSPPLCPCRRRLWQWPCLRADRVCLSAAACPAERELTSPSRLRTHDSTGSGSHQRTGSRQAAKRRRTSAGRAGSSQHA